jgi:hypothetical protein
MAGDWDGAWTGLGPRPDAAWIRHDGPDWAGG